MCIDILHGGIVVIRIDEHLPAHIRHAQHDAGQDGLIEPELPRKGLARIELLQYITDTEVHFPLGLIIKAEINSQARHKAHQAEHNKKDGTVKAGNLRRDAKLCRFAIHFDTFATQPGLNP